MRIINVGETASLVKSETVKSFSNLFRNTKGLSSQLDQRLASWSRDSKQSLLEENPFVNHAQKLDEWQQLQAVKDQWDYERLIKDFQQFSQAAQIPFDEVFWQEQIGGVDKRKTEKGQDSSIAEQLLLNDWQKKLDEAHTNWHLGRLQLLRSALLAEIDEWLSIFVSLQESLGKLGFELGIWLDLSQGELTPQDVAQFKRWAQYLTEDKGAQTISELLGKMRQIAQSERIEKIKKSVDVDTPRVDVSSKEEIVGVAIGRDIENVIPAELALLADPDTAILFDLKYLESRLLSFEMQGTSFAKEEHEVEIEDTAIEDEQVGPMILCIDTSGSMAGEPENIAKAMALFLSNQARSQSRPCYLINFSTEIETFELTGGGGLANLISFLSQSFHGGTDATPALHHTLDVMTQEAYEKADVLVISDFIMNELPSDVLKLIESQRESQNTFNSLVVGDAYMYQRLETHFDHEWAYNPRTSRIQELIQFNHKITNC